LKGLMIALIHFMFHLCVSHVFLLCRLPPCAGESAACFCALRNV